MSAMFSNTRSSAGPAGGNAHILEFKAGRSELSPGSDPKKVKVVANKAKGLIFIKQSSDQLLHFCWKNRETGETVDDLIIFPGDTEFKEVKGCPDGHVFMLKFKNTKDQKLYWLQEPDYDKDLCQKINDALNKSPQQHRMSARGGASERTSTNRNTAFGGIDANFGNDLGGLSGIDQNHLAQLLQYMTPNSDSTAANAGNDVDMSNSAAGSAASQPGSSSPPVNLSDVIAGERASETVRRNQDRLLPHVPPSDEPKVELVETVHSPQFLQASNDFGRALQTGQMGPVLKQFGVNDEASQAASEGNIVEFAKKLTEEEQKSEEPSANDSIKEPERKRGKPDDDNMELD